MKILLVDDDPLERTALRDILRAQGDWTIVEAPNGKKAQEMLFSGLEPDVCIFDVKMPDMPGVQLLGLIRQDPLLKHLKVIMTSSGRDRDTIVALGKLGISGYLLKPYTLERTGPALTQMLGAAKITVSSLAARNLLGKTVMIVDDDAITRRALREMIESAPDRDVIEAEDGLFALEQFRSGVRPDLALFDLKMPRLDGQTLLARVRDDPSLQKLPVIVVSGQQDRERIKALVQLRISGYLLKPFDPSKVKDAVQQVLNGGAVGSTPPMSVTQSA
jgi:two-component system chemotaxis response regulator CheY